MNTVANDISLALLVQFNQCCDDGHDFVQSKSSARGEGVDTFFNLDDTFFEVTNSLFHFVDICRDLFPCKVAYLFDGLGFGKVLLTGGDKEEKGSESKV